MSHSRLAIKRPYQTYGRIRSRILLAITAMVLLLSASAIAAQSSSVAVEKQLFVGDSEIIPCVKLVRATIGDPNIVDVAALSSKELLMNAKAQGRTVLYVWDKRGKRTYNITVLTATPDMSKICDTISKEIDDPRITVRSVGNTVILEGRVSTEAESVRIESIANAVAETEAYQGNYPESKSQSIKSVSRPQGDSFVVERNVEQTDNAVKAQTGLRCPKVVNLLKIEKPIGEVSVRTLEIAGAVKQALNNSALTIRALPGSVVLIEGRVGTPTEIEQINLLIKGWEKKGTDNKGGIDASNTLAETVTIVNSVTVDSSVARQILVRAKILDINRTDLQKIGVDWGSVTFDTNGNPIVNDQPFLIGETGLQTNLFTAGRISRLQPLGARIQALITNNKARVLSEPALLVLDGREANMLVGGEVPIPIVQSAQIGSAASISVVFKEFGVRLRILPSVAGGDRLQLKVMPEVSALDFADAVTFSGFVIPAFTTRRAETTVNIGNGQSLIIGGLVQRNISEIIRKIPLLGDIPILGELFKTKSYQNGETELVIVITPEIVNPATSPNLPELPKVPELPPTPPVQPFPAAPK